MKSAILFAAVAFVALAQSNPATLGRRLVGSSGAENRLTQPGGPEATKEPRQRRKAGKKAQRGTSKTTGVGSLQGGVESLFIADPSGTPAQPPAQVTKPIPNIDVLKSGVNFLLVNTAEGISAASGPPIIQFSQTQIPTTDARYLVPNNTFVVVDGRCQANTVATDTTSIEEYRKTITQRIAITFSFGFLTASLSHTVTDQTIRYQKDETQTWHAEGSCNWYRVSWLPGPFMQPTDTMSYYMNYLKMDPTSEDAWQDFFNTLGTHYWQNIDLGGLLMQDSSLSFRNQTNVKSHEVDDKLQVQLKFKFSIGLVAEKDVKTTEYQTWTKNAQVGNVMNIGGDPAKANKYWDWVATVADYPEPIGGHLEPIKTLFQHWGHADLAAAYDEQLRKWFLVQAAAQDLNIPQLVPFPTDIAIGNRGKWLNPSTAKCGQSGSVVLSGGCTSFPGDNSMYVDTQTCNGQHNPLSTDAEDDPCQKGTHPWMLHASMPVSELGNGVLDNWFCQAGEDYGAHVYDRSAMAQAVCAQSEIPLANFGKINLDVQHVDCESPSSIDDDHKYSSDCEAICPEGYYVTGGGCWTDDVFSGNDSEHPWRITATRPGIYGDRTGWYCKMAQDDGSRDAPNMPNHYQYRVTKGRAICAKWNHDIEGLPQLPRRHVIKKQESGKGAKFAASAKLYCGEGMFALGGGAEASPTTENEPNKDWALRMTAPLEGAGWGSFAGEDWNSQTYYNSVMNYLICVEFL